MAIVFIKLTPIKPPHSIQVDGATVSPFNISSSYLLTTTFNVNFSFNAEEQLQIFENIKGGVSLKSYEISSQNLDPLLISGKNSMNRVNAEFVASSVQISPQIAESVISVKAKSGIVPFTLNINGSLSKRFHKTAFMIASCEDIPIQFFNDSNVGSLYHAPLLCKFKLSKP
ncbi:hypothetical protein M5689_019156 [Euphorbia peplus]|nr:hypothetical protein M5689_019156 [Euphorbia peplus]